MCQGDGCFEVDADDVYLAFECFFVEEAFCGVACVVYEYAEVLCVAEYLHEFAEVHGVCQFCGNDADGDVVLVLQFLCQFTEEIFASAVDYEVVSFWCELAGEFCSDAG